MMFKTVIVFTTLLSFAAAVSWNFNVPYTRYRNETGSHNNPCHQCMGARNMPFLRPEPYLAAAASLPPSTVVAESVLRGGVGAPWAATNLLFTAIGQFLANDIAQIAFQGPTEVLGDAKDPVYFTHINPKPEDTKIRNMQSAFVDLSNLYGSLPLVTKSIRTLQGGQLKTGSGNLLPVVKSKRFSFAPSSLIPEEDLFVCGDSRCNDNVLLQVLHIIFTREHNRKAKEFAELNPTWDDERLFQEARVWLIAVWQNIVFNEYLPYVLDEPLPPYAGYDSNVDPQIDVFILGAVLRRVDSEIPPGLSLLVKSPESTTPSKSTAATLAQTGIDSVLTEMIKSKTNTPNTPFTNETYAVLPGIGRVDLGAIDIQLGREIGLQAYNYYRRKYGLSEITSFGDARSPSTRVAGLTSAYASDSIANLDAYVGGITEALIPGKAAGPLFAAAFSEQFKRLRSGDFYYFESPGSGITANELGAVRARTLRKLISGNSGLTSLPYYPMGPV